MTLREAVDLMESLHFTNVGSWADRYSEALRVVIETAREHLDDTAEIPTPCPTCRNRREVTHLWDDGTAAVSPCPTCRPTPVPPGGGK